MKKTKLLALTLVVAIMLVGAGYAAWNEVLVHNNKIDTGNLELKFTRVYSKPTVIFNNAAVKAFAEPVAPAASPIISNFTSEGTGNNTKEITFKFKDAFPGTKMQAHSTISNLGTLAAVINEVKVDITDKDGVVVTQSDLFDAMTVNYRYYILKDGEGVGAARVEIYKTNVPLGSLKTELKSDLEGHYLNPQEQLTGGDEEEESAYWIHFEIPMNSLTGNQGENDELNIKITYDFEQYNAYNGTIKTAGNIK